MLYVYAIQKFNGSSTLFHCRKPLMIENDDQLIAFKNSIDPKDNVFLPLYFEAPDGLSLNKAKKHRNYLLKACGVKRKKMQNLWVTPVHELEHVS